MAQARQVRKVKAFGQLCPTGVPFVDALGDLSTAITSWPQLP